MEQRVLLTIISTQRFQDEEPEITQLVTEGLLAIRESCIELSYAETELTGLKGTKTSFCIEKDRVSLYRSGAVQSQMTFVEGVEDRSLYDMGFGALMIAVRTERILWDLNEKGGKLLVSYGIVVEEEATGFITYEIRVQPLKTYKKG